MTKLKVCQIVPYIHNEVSGPSYSVPSLSVAIKKLHYHIILITLFNKKKESGIFKIFNISLIVTKLSNLKKCLCINIFPILKVI